MVLQGKTVGRRKNSRMQGKMEGAGGLFPEKCKEIPKFCITGIFFLFKN